MSSLHSLEGPSLLVHNERNRLRKLPFAEVVALPPVGTEVTSFRGTPVCIATAWVKMGDVAAVLVRGKMFGGRVTQEASFMKLPSGAWAEVPEEVLNQLRNVIADAVPNFRPHSR